MILGFLGRLFRLCDRYCITTQLHGYEKRTEKSQKFAFVLIQSGIIYIIRNDANLNTKLLIRSSLEFYVASKVDSFRVKCYRPITS